MQAAVVSQTLHCSFELVLLAAGQRRHEGLIVSCFLSDNRRETNMNKTTLIIVIVVLVLGAGLYANFGRWWY